MLQNTKVSERLKKKYIGRDFEKGLLKLSVLKSTEI